MAFSTTEPPAAATASGVLVTESAEQTRKLGERIGKLLRVGDCLSLRGELGAGKTVLTQGLVAGAGGGADVRSPTFVLHAVHAGRIPVHHLDLYRLGEPVELNSLGLGELLEDGAAVVEWPERALEQDWFSGEVALTVMGPSRRRLEWRLPGHLREALADG